MSLKTAQQETEEAARALMESAQQMARSCTLQNRLLSELSGQIIAMRQIIRVLLSANGVDASSDDIEDLLLACASLRKPAGPSSRVH